MKQLSKLWAWLRYPVALGILAVLYWLNREALQKVAVAPKRWGYFQLGVALLFGSTLLTFFRWYLLVWAQEFPFRFRDALRLGFIGLMFNYVGPGALGGDLFKAVFLCHGQKSRRTVAVATILLDRILGMLALFMVGALASLMPIDVPERFELKTATALLWIGAISGLAGLLLLLAPMTTRWRWVNRLGELRYVGRFLDELVHGVRLYQSKPTIVLATLGLSVVSHSGLIAGFYCCALWIHQPWIPDLTTHFYFMPNAELFSVLIPIPGGVGALEGAVSWFYVLLKPEQVAAGDAGAAGLLAALAYRVVTIGIAAVGGAYYLVARREVAEALREENPNEPLASTAH